MTSLYGKCVGIVKNSESNTATKENCKWKSDNPNFELASFGNVKVKSMVKLMKGKCLIIFKNSINKIGL